MDIYIYICYYYLCLLMRITIGLVIECGWKMMMPTIFKLLCLTAFQLKNLKQVRSSIDY